MPEQKRFTSSIRELLNNIDRILYFLSRVSYFTLNLYNKRQFRKKINKDYPDFIGLSISRLCGANCIFCPITRTQKQIKKMPFMDMRTIDKIITELKERDFRGTISLGENGDALLHHDFKPIVKKIHENLKGKTILFTNMMQVDREMSKFLLENDLKLLHLNVDGNSKETYEYAKKGCKFDVVKRNLHDFIDLRKKIGGECGLVIKVLPPKRYMQYVEGKKIDLPYDAKETIAYWSPHLSKKDSITEYITFSRWAVNPHEPRQIPCIYTTQLLDNCYISTEGDAYLCCLDYFTEMTYGNVQNSSIHEIWNSPKRKEIIKAIIWKDYKKIGKPCVTCNEENDLIRSYLNYLTYKG